MTGNVWTQKEIEILHKTKNLSATEQTKILNKSVNSIYKKRFREKIVTYNHTGEYTFKHQKCPFCGASFYDHNKTCGKEECRRKAIAKKLLNEQNGQWKGEDVGYGSLHRWIERHKPKPALCMRCHKRPLYDLANISGKYKRDINDFEWLCRRCHMNDDGRIKNLKQFGVPV
jgi:hypothetical protein